MNKSLRLFTGGRDVLGTRLRPATPNLASPRAGCATFHKIHQLGPMRSSSIGTAASWLLLVLGHAAGKMLAPMKRQTAQRLLRRLAEESNDLISIDIGGTLAKVRAACCAPACLSRGLSR
jgi:hypothetical protein